MSQRIVYTCKKCGWKGSIIADWFDFKPKKCPNRKCRLSFLKYPELLEIYNPTEKKVEGDK
jgi:hypothetical protein